MTPTGVKPFIVRGLLEPQGVARALGGRLVVMDLYAAQRAFAADGQINQIDLVLDPGAEVAATRTALTAALPPGLEVQEPALRKEVVRDGVAAFQSMLTAFGLLAVVAGFVICYSRLGAIFEARTWEVGLLRAGGLRRSVVFRELLKESVLLGAAGAALGIPLGVLVARVGLPFLATTTALASNLPVPEAKLGSHVARYPLRTGTRDWSGRCSCSGSSVADVPDPPRCGADNAGSGDALCQRLGRSGVADSFSGL